MRLAAGNAQHAGSREEQQDAFGFSDLSDRELVENAGVAAVVADGMGGLADGDLASKVAVRVFLNSYASKDPAETIPDALLRAIQQANHAVTNLSRETRAGNSLGTTLAAMVMHEDWLYWISAGDSRVYLYRDGRVTRLTSDHNYAADLEEDVIKGTITREEALHHPDRAALTSYLGCETLPKVDRSIRPFPLQPGDCALICSDGLYRSLSDEEIAATLGKDPHKTCEALVESALAKKLAKQDNVTVVALKCDVERPSFMITLARLVAVLALGLLGGVYWWQISSHVQPPSVDLSRFQPRPPPVMPVPPASLGAATMTEKTKAKARVEPPTIKNFFAIPETVGPDEPVTLSWTVTGKVDTITMAPEVGPGRLKWRDARQVVPAKTTTYVLTAEGVGGSRSKSVTVAVKVPEPDQVK